MTILWGSSGTTYWRCSGKDLTWISYGPVSHRLRDDSHDFNIIQISNKLFFSVDLQEPNPFSHHQLFVILVPSTSMVGPSYPFPTDLAGVRPSKWYLSYYVWHPECFKIGKISMLLWDLILHFCVQPISLTYTRHILAVSILYLGPWASQLYVTVVSYTLLLDNILFKSRYWASM